MRTQKAVSAIAYHRPAVFDLVTNQLRQCGSIGPCLWVPHRGEDGDKDHIHLVLVGGFKVYNTSSLSSLWGVDIIDGQAASVSALWHTTKSLSDWVLYAIHNPEYLLHKGLERCTHYDWTDIHITKGDEVGLAEIIADAREALEQLGDRTTRRLVQLARSGYTWRRVVLSGLVPMGQLSQAWKAWRVIQREEAADDWEGLHGAES